MSFASRRYADVTVATPTGRINHETCGGLEQALAPLVDPAASPAGLVLDFSGVDYISSVGLRVLMVTSKSMRARRSRIAIAALKPVVAEIFTISRFDAVLDVYPTVADALAAISPAALAAWRGREAGAHG